MVTNISDDQSLLFLVLPSTSASYTKIKSRYRLAIPIVVRVACMLLKLAHATTMRLSSELFVIGRTIVSNVVYDTCRAINIALYHEIS